MIKKGKSDFILVISWWWAKGIYACGILKALEELDFKKQIKAVYGVSAGALTGAYWLSGWHAEAIFERFLESEILGLKNFAIPPKLSLLKGSTVEAFLKKDLKSDFSDLEAEFFVGATDIMTAKFILFNEGKLVPPVLGSMAVPGLFPPVAFERHLLVDWGVLNNFPVDFARKAYPDAKIIWILLGKFKQHQKVTSLLDVLSLSYSVALQGRLSKNLDKVDYLLYKDLEVGMVESSEKKLRALFKQGYEDGLKAFSSRK